MGRPPAGPGFRTVIVVVPDMLWPPWPTVREEVLSHVSNQLWEQNMQEMILRPALIGQSFGGHPMIRFEERLVRGKSRLIGIPNRAMRVLHRRFGEYLCDLVMATDGRGYGVRKLPSATGCVRESNPHKNAKAHQQGTCFYITDLVDAYANVSLERLALFITFLIRYEDYADQHSLGWFGKDERVDGITDDWMYEPVLGFLRSHFSGQFGRGLAIGGPLSPYLMNLYCEVFLDMPLRKLCERRRITYTRYVDDLVFSATFFIGQETRRQLRAIIEGSGFAVNHRKSRLELLSMGPSSVTKVGIDRSFDLDLFRGRRPPTPESMQGESFIDRPRLVYSQRKRRRLHGIIHSYLALEMDWPEKVSGYAAEFLYYYKQVEVKTATDRKTFALCRLFLAEWQRHGGPRYRLSRHK